jgi:hypothetical protein
LLGCAVSAISNKCACVDGTGRGREMALYTEDVAVFH